MRSLAVGPNPRAHHVEVTEDELVVYLRDGRTISVPLAWFPRLLYATRERLGMWELLGDGEGVHWPQLDEDPSVAGLLPGTPAPQPTA